MQRFTLDLWAGAYLCGWPWLAALLALAWAVASWLASDPDDLDDEGPQGA
jgi:hypothetical protein